MFGKASEIKLVELSSTSHFETWAKKNPDADVLDIKYSFKPGSSSFFSTPQFLVIYKQPTG